MGLLVDGKWSNELYDTKRTGGRFVREAAHFRNWITPDGSAGPSGSEGFKADSSRYHLYVSHECPWAHRTMIFRRLKGLERHVSVSVVHPLMLDKGWGFARDAHATGDALYGFDHLYQLYLKSRPEMSGRVTVPVLWDKWRGEIVSNESSEIIRMFNSAFNDITGNDVDFWPADARPAIETVNNDIYNNINNGVYKAGFATSSEAYEEAVTKLFDALDRVEVRLGQERYLLGNRLTEADWRLFTTLIRFDAVYVGHFKCNLRRIADYPALSGYLRDLYQMPGISETVVMPHIKQHYYMSHRHINPSGIVPKGPILDFDRPHGRG